MGDRRKMRYVKYHALGNDYVVIPATESTRELNTKNINLICHRNYGVGSDGILLGPLQSKKCDFRLRILNPDGSEAEKSGNGLRIFSRFLWVEMGRVSFDSANIPVTGNQREVLCERMEIADRVFEFCAATVGNPHCIVLCNAPTADVAKRYGPLIERDARFPNRTNVQFMAIINRRNIRIEIWERGAGYTLASGSSSTAAAAVAKKLGFCNSDICVHMPGGALAIRLSDGFEATMKGPVVRICSGDVDDEIFEELRTGR
jgi:diaminopimelate epimerase